MFILYDSQMRKIEYPKGIIPLDIFIHSIKKDRTSGTEEGRTGKIDYGSIKRDREIELRFYMKASVTNSYRLLRNDLFRILGDDHYYISEVFDKGKVYKISIDEPYIPTRGNQLEAVIDVKCQTVDLPFGMSIGRSGEIERDGLSASSGLWGSGMGLLPDPASQKYKFNAVSTADFRVYNPGVEIHPFEMDLHIKVSNVQGNTSGFQITNRTNSSRFIFSKQIVPTDIIRFIGPRVTINNLEAFRDLHRNKQFIYLSSGWNNLRIYYSTSATVEFDTHFYYD